MALAAASPWLAYRGAAYIAGGFAGIAGLALLLVQPLLAAGWLPGPRLATARRWHRRLGAALVLLVVAHVALLWVVSPQDVEDALTLTSPTPFSVWGVTALAAVLATGALATRRRRLGPRAWRRLHAVLALVILGATVAHALLIEGAMEPLSKFLLGLAAMAAGAAAVARAPGRGLARRTPPPGPRDGRRDAAAPTMHSEP